MKSFAVTINGKKRSVEAVPDTPLLWVLREYSQADRRRRAERSANRPRGRERYLCGDGAPFAETTIDL